MVILEGGNERRCWRTPARSFPVNNPPRFNSMHVFADRFDAQCRIFQKIIALARSKQQHRPFSTQGRHCFPLHFVLLQACLRHSPSFSDPTPLQGWRNATHAASCKCTKVPSSTGPITIMPVSARNLNQTGWSIHAGHAKIHGSIEHIHSDACYSMSSGYLPVYLHV